MPPRRRNRSFRRWSTVPAHAPSGIPVADGFSDYVNLINERDGGLNGVKLRVEECETQYNTERGVECYERLKAQGGTIFSPYSTGITYALLDRAAADKSVIFSMGYGRDSATVGNIFPWGIGRESCREGVCQSVYISVSAVSLHKKKNN